MSRETSDSPESCRTGSSSGRLLQVVLASATPSVSSPSRPLPQKELEELNAPGWENNLQEAIVWFYRLRAAVKSIVYRFINNMKAAMALFERHHVEYYAGHSRLEEAIPKIWRCWNQFISTNSMTEDCLRQLNFLADLRENIQNMTMTPYRVPRTSRDEMGNIRDNARFIAVEGYSVFDMAIEALTLLEEKQVGHEIDELFPTIPEYADAPNLEAPAGAEEDTEEEILRSGGIRDPEKLDRTRFAPVWIRHYGFPDSASDELLEELREIVGTGSGLAMAGSMRTIFWLTGWDNIVDMIDDPAYVIEDEMEAVPIGTRIDSFLLGRYLFEERKLPAFLDAWSQYDDPASGYRPFVVRAVPSVVQTTVSRAGVCALYPWARQQCMPESIRVVSSKNEKAPAKFFGRVQNLFPDGLLTMSGLLFRGMGLYSLELMMTFFIPRISTNNKDNEFGPGIYTTTDFEYAKRYAGSNGAMMVFRDVDNRDLFVWEPKGDDWSQLIGHYTNLQQSDDHVPAKRKGADVIRGPISATREGTTRVTRGSLVPDVNTIQQAFVSYRSCERLAASLVAIIYISGS